MPATSIDILPTRLYSKSAAASKVRAQHAGAYASSLTERIEKFNFYTEVELLLNFANRSSSGDLLIRQWPAIGAVQRLLHEYGNRSQQ